METTQNQTESETQPSSSSDERLAPQGPVNGIDVDAVRQLASSIAAEPARGMAEFSARTRWTGGLASQSHIDHWSLGGERLGVDWSMDVDEPKELAGQGRGPNPQMVLMTALNTCMLNTYVAAASVMGVALEHLEFESRGELDLRGFLGVDPTVDAGYHRIDLTIRVKGNGTRAQYEKMLELVQRQSPNYYNITHAIELAPTLEVQG